MTIRTYEFRISPQQLNCLEKLALDDRTLTDLLKDRIASRGGTVFVKVTPSEAESIRQRLTERLAEIGFDENYFPNQQGQALEALIDQFFVAGGEDVQH
jgi:hypothetical protein